MRWKGGKEGIVIRKGGLREGRREHLHVFVDENAGEEVHVLCHS